MSKSSKKPSSIWIAHRGVPCAFPENTLPGYQAAIDCGARYIEADIQLSSDGVPFLYHDAELQRMSGSAGKIFDLPADKVSKLTSSDPERFGDKFKDVKIATLASLVTLLKQHPKVIAFIEIKEESIKRFGLAVYIDRVIQGLTPIQEQCVLISFVPDAISYVQQTTKFQTGWVVPEWKKYTRQIAHSLNPQWLFCNKKRLPKKNSKIWRGDWQWVIYIINSNKSRKKIRNRGFRYIETDCITEFIDEKR